MRPGAARHRKPAAFSIEPTICSLAPEPFIERFFRVDQQVRTHFLFLRKVYSLFYRVVFFGRKLHGPVPTHSLCGTGYAISEFSLNQSQIVLYRVELMLKNVPCSKNHLESNKQVTSFMISLIENSIY